MKRGVFIAGFLIASLCLASCRNEEALTIGPANKTFKKLPALCLAEANEQYRIDKEMKMTYNPDKQVRYGVTKVEVAQAIRQRLDQEAEKVKGRKVPFETSSQLNYRVLSAEVSGWDYPNRTVQVLFRIVPGQGAVAAQSAGAFPDSLCYLKCVDKDGNTLAAATLRPEVAKDGATDNGQAVLEGVYGCSFQKSRLFDFTGFDRVVFIPAAEYQAACSRLTDVEQEAQRAEAAAQNKGPEYVMMPGQTDIPGLPPRTKK